MEFAGLQCNWVVVESGVAAGTRYSIHNCATCEAEAVVIDGRVNLKQWRCPSDTMKNEGDIND